MTKPELIVPAGNLEKMKTAFAFGADAVYLGIPDFSLRVRINDFTLADIKTAVDYAHGLGKKVYVTVNIFAHNEHLDKLPSYLHELRDYGVDGLFVSDPGILQLIKKHWPQANLALSTQANCTNWLSAKFWQERGCHRVILGRELSLAEIKEIKDKVPGLELECFVHGALCMAYSGRCFLSKFLNNGQRDANLGDCAQPCRWQYDVTIRPQGQAKTLELVEEEHGSYLLNSQDLCLLKRLPELIAVGLDAFKIEGRAKSVYYLANVVGAYRQAIDLIIGGSGNLTEELDKLYNELTTKLYHRGYTEGFMFQQGQLAQNLDNSHNDPDWEFCGQVLSCQAEDKGYRLTVKVHNTMQKGDRLELVQPYYDIMTIKLGEMVDQASQTAITEAHGGGGGQIIYITVTKPVVELSVIRRKVK
ncbi:MAG: U32 family peptidase C-terminal domain-containing protein [bacterium]